MFQTHRQPREVSVPKRLTVKDKRKKQLQGKECKRNNRRDRGTMWISAAMSEFDGNTSIKSIFDSVESPDQLFKSNLQIIQKCRTFESLLNVLSLAGRVDRKHD